MLRWFDGVRYTEHVAPAQAHPHVQPKSLGDDAGMRMLLPVGRSGWAIAAGYLGLFAFIPIFAPIAVIVSGIAMWHISRDERRYGWGRAIFGMVMGVLMSIVLVLIFAAQ